MAPKKGGFILRAEVRRVECPVCHAGPGKLCTTFDKREHPERTTLAIETQPTTDAGDPKPKTSVEEATALVQIPEQILEARGGTFTHVVTEAAEDHPALNFAAPAPRESSVPLGLNVFVDIQHGPTKFSWRGRLEDFDVRHRSLNLLGENGPQTIQWGANDMIIITDDR